MSQSDITLKKYIDCNYAIQRFLISQLNAQPKPRSAEVISLHDGYVLAKCKYLIDNQMKCVCTDRSYVHAQTIFVFIQIKRYSLIMDQFEDLCSHMLRVCLNLC